MKSERQGGRTAITDRFREWLNERYEILGAKDYHQFIRLSGLHGDTATRWRNGVQIPTAESIEKAVGAYAAYRAEADSREGGHAASRKEIETNLLARLVGVDGYVAQLRKTIAEKDAAIAKLKARARENDRTKK